MLPRSVGSDNMAMPGQRLPARGAEALTEPAPRPRPRVDREATPAPRSRVSAPRESEADVLNAISQAFIRGERPRGGAAENIGRAMGIEDYKKGGMVKAKAPVKKMAKGGVVKKMSSGGAARRGDGCATRGKTKGRMV